MRKLGILVALTAAATLGIAGTASAQEQVQGPLCDQVIGGIAEGAVGSPIENTTAGLQESCNESFEEQQVRPSPALCGVTEDLNATPLAPVGGIVDQVHGGLAGGVPENPIVGFGHPCGGGDNGGDPPAAPTVEGASTDPVQAANAAADGGLPRTGGELFAGAGFGLASLGALIRRFIG